MKIFSTFLFFLFILNNLSAQTVKVEGRIINLEDRKAIQFAAIQIKGQVIGTVSNQTGYFVMNIPLKFADSLIIISSIGFESKSISINEIKKGQNIELIPKIYDISEILVKPKDPIEIINSALKKVNENYSQKPVCLDGFYREMMQENNQFIELAEAATNFYYAPYEKYDIPKAVSQYFQTRDIPDLINDYTFDFQMFNLVTHPDDQVKIIEARSTEYLHNEHFKVIISGGPLNIAACDVVKNVSDSEHQFINPKFFKYYQYELIDISSYNNKRVYVIGFSPKNLKKAWWKGKLFVDIESEAFISVEYEFEPQSKIKKQIFTFIYNPALFTKKNSKCKNYFELKNQKVKVDYKQVGDKWYLSHIKRERYKSLNFSKYYIYYKNQPSINYYSSAELIINDIKSKAVKPFNEEETLENSYSTVLQAYESDYNESFWENYNILKSTPLEDSIKAMLETKKQLTAQFRDKVLRDENINVPVAQIKPDTIFIHNDTLIDNYKWLEKVDNPKVLEYIEEENKYTDNYMKPLKELRKNLFDEMKKRMDFKREIPKKKQIGDYLFYYEQPKSKNYPYIIKENVISGKKEAILDANSRSQKNTSYAIGGMDFSPGGKYFAFYEQKEIDYEIYAFIFDIEKNKIIDSIKNAYPLDWLNNRGALIYSTWDSTNRVNRILIHDLKQASQNDKVLLEEKDIEREVSFMVCKNYVFIESYSGLSSKQLFFKKNDPSIELKFICEENEQPIGIYEKHDRLEIRRGDSLFISSFEKYQPQYWKFIGTDADVFADKETANFVIKIKLDKLREYLAIYNKVDSSLYQIVEFKKTEFNHLEFIDDSISEKNDCFKYKYSTLALPDCYFDFDITNKEARLIYQDTIPGYNPDKYVEELLWVKTIDNEFVPLSLFYKKGLKRNGTAPVFQTS
ncbi:MAG: carboxypeptidase-like regulatory domain-containing protein, partial [Bacteroidales bacterium]|nr:carboxypeptidase-like regulatory domain-containing protein [Bacteroidales bacterium]